jgi:hypothetical protein
MESQGSDLSGFTEEIIYVIGIPGFMNSVRRKYLVVRFKALEDMSPERKKTTPQNRSDLLH